MKNEPEPPDADEYEELLQALESSSQQVVELSQKLAETAMARIVGRRRIDLRALKSLDMLPGKYQISISTPDDLKPRVTLSWQPGELILGPDLIPTERDVRLPIPTIRETVCWAILPPITGKIPLPPSPLEPGPSSEAQRKELARLLRTRSQAWEQHHQAQSQAAMQRMSMDQVRASQDEEIVAEAMMSEIEARRADPKKDAGQTISEVGQKVANQFLETSRLAPV